MNNAIYFLIIAILAYSCASEVAPTGGPKDTTPPAIVESVPDNLSINFNSDVINITFDEFFQLNNYKQKLLISPPLEKEPDIHIKGKRLIIKLKEQLIPNTTYRFFFDDAIADYNENNPLKNFTFTVSTGDFIDSLSVAGTVKDAFTLKPVKDAMVFLYDDLSDSAFTNKKPYYIAKTDENGNFTINNVRDTVYNIFSIIESDKSLNYNLPTEQIAFNDFPIHPLDSTIMPLELLMFIKEDSTQAISFKESNLNYASFGYKIPPIAPEIVFLNEMEFEPIIEYSINKDTVKISTKNIDTLNIIAIDNKITIDTLRFVVSSQRMIDNFKFNISNSGKNVSDDDSLLLSFNNLIDKILIDSAQVIMSIDTIVDTTYKKMTYLDSINKVMINTSLETGASYNITICDSTFTDINGHYSKKHIWDAKIINKDDLGGFVLKIVADSTLTSDHDYIVKLFDANSNQKAANKVVRLMQNDTTTVTYKSLSSGKYSCLIIEDNNGNGKWTSGDYSHKRQPERVFYSNQVEVKDKFDIEEIVIIK